ncbi:MAG: galactokinase [Candidatus Thermoplasmatota archaeon]|nr:galactokinase [Candidatus Thermoplasmatota archaeon]
MRVIAPGRVNLLGEHTDYNGGFVLPCAVNREIGINFEDSGEFELYSEIYNDHVKQEDKIEGWKSYVLGTKKEISKHYKTREIKGEIRSTIPAGSGMSSSAALEIAVALAIIKNRRAKPMSIAKLCRRAEHRYAGVKCGIMDQASVILSKKNNLFFLDCRELSYSYAPFDSIIVVVDSGTKHELSASYYNRRVSECKRSAKILSTKNLREAWEKRLELSSLEGKLKKRAEHFFSEMDRVVEAADALRNRDMHKFGELMNLSHLSLSQKFEVSTPLMDKLQMKLSALCYGAKLTGAGFGGSIVGICEEEDIEKIKEAFEGFQIYFLRSTDGAWFSN